MATKQDNNFRPRRSRIEGETFKEYHGSAKNLTENHRKFAEEFVSSFDIDAAAKASTTVASIMAAKLDNPCSPVSIHINNLLDRRRVANGYFNIESLYSELLKLFRDPKVRATDRLTAGKLLLGVQVEPDDSREKFDKVLAALAYSGHAEKVVQDARQNTDNTRTEDNANRD